MTRTLVAAALLTLFAAACGSGTNGSCSATDVPTACPSGGAPSYANAVAPVINAQCNGCHSFTSYAATSARSSAILGKVANCSMPQGSSLTASERTTVLNWTVCGAPNN